MAHDPKYKMRYRPEPISRLRKYSMPLPMAGDPKEAWQAYDWDRRCRIVYDYMISLKKGVVPKSKRRGLWFYAERTPM